MKLASVNFAYILLIFVSYLVQIGISTENEDVPRVGIVGAGIGGTSASYFLKELFGGKVEIDIFEKQHVGGRLAPITISGQNYNAGGSVIHLANVYMVNFTEMLGLKRDVNAISGTLALFDGSEIVFSTSSYTAVTLAKMFWRYGMDIYNIRPWVKDNILDGMKRLYKFQQEGHAFSNVEDLLNAINPICVDFTKKSTKDLMKEHGFSDRFIDEFVMAGLRNNYGQTTDVQGMVGAVSMAGIEPGVWKVVGGNHQVPQGLLRESGANLIRGKVTTVALSSEGSPPSYEINYLPGRSENEDDIKAKEYDIVILATPLYRGMSDIKFEDFQTTIKPVAYDFHKTIATFIEGLPNTSYFGIDNLEDFPTEFFTTNTSLFFNSLGKEKTVDGEVPSKPVYKMFLNKAVSVDVLKQIIPEWSDLRMVDWMAYPEYESSISLPSFTLHEQMYHINAIEMVASAMEMSVVGAKNVALLAYYRYTGQYDKIDEVLTTSEGTEKTEL